MRQVWLDGDLEQRARHIKRLTPSVDRCELLRRAAVRLWLDCAPGLDREQQAKLRRGIDSVLANAGAIIAC